MLRRLRWFTLGVTAGVGGSAWLVGQLRRAGGRPRRPDGGKAATLELAALLEAGSKFLSR